jgi:hypothetical protein
MKISMKDSGTFAPRRMAKNTATNICPGSGIIEQNKPIAVAREMDIRLTCHNSRRSSKFSKRLSPLIRMRRFGLSRYFRNDRFGISLT